MTKFSKLAVSLAAACTSAIRTEKTLASLLATSNSRMSSFLKQSPIGTTDCAEFTYHVVADSTACYALCQQSKNADVKANCEYYSGWVDLCSATEYEYASHKYKQVDVPENLEAKCNAGEAVERCKVCDRVLSLEEQEYVHDTPGHWWEHYAMTGVVFILVSIVVGMWLNDPVQGFVCGAVLLGLWSMVGLYHVIPYEFSKWYIFNPSRWLIFRPHEW